MRSVNGPITLRNSLGRPMNVRYFIRCAKRRTAQKNRLFFAAILCAVGMAPYSSIAQDDASALADTDEDTLEPIVVTGSRLTSAHRTSPAIVIDRDSIDARGFTTAEDIIASIPQNFSTINRARGISQPVGGDGIPVGSFGQGEAAADLRGLGSNATLVLINGRRSVGSAGFNGTQVNLSKIPAAAIERVEVLLDGASATYGSDALGGVINFILKKDYEGATTTLSYQNSSTESDKFEISQLAGFGWDTGNLTATVVHSKTDPVITAETGFTTLDYTSRGGPDARNTFLTQPGNVFGFGSLPADFDGTSFTFFDLSPLNIVPADNVPLQQTAEVESLALTVFFEQRFGESSSFFTEIYVSEGDTTSQLNAPFFIGLVQPWDPVNMTGNPLNTLGFPVFVGSYLLSETNAGLIPYGGTENDSKDLTLNAGFLTELGDSGWVLDVAAGYGSSENQALSIGYDIFGNTILADRINPFGNGTAQNIDAVLDSYGVVFDRTRKSRLANINGHVVGEVFELPAGAWEVVLGAEYRSEELDQSADEIGLLNGTLADTKPKQTITALFFENSIPLAETVNAVVQGRWEEYEVDSSAPPPLDGQPRPVSPALEAILSGPINGRTLSNFSPRLAVRWDATETFSLRASWGESFKAPNLTQVVGAYVQALTPGTFPLFDPVQGTVAFPFSDRSGNPSLEPEFATTINVGFDWSPSAIQGLQISLNYSDVEYEDRITANPLSAFGFDFILANPQLFPGFAARDPVTNDLVSLTLFPINVAQRNVESVDFAIGYSWNNGAGDFSVRLDGVRTITFEDIIAPGETPRERLGTSSSPNELVGTFTFEWLRDNYSVRLFGNHTDSYRNTEAPVAFSAFYAEAPTIGSYTTWDFSANYTFERAQIDLTVGARNLFDREFPFAAGFGGPFDLRRIDTRGRVIFATLRKDFDF